MVSHIECASQKLCGYDETAVFTPVLVLHGDTGWPLFSYKVKINMLRLSNRLVCLNDSRLTKQVFLWDYDKCNNNWCANVKSFFHVLYMDQTYVRLSICVIDQAANNLYISDIQNLKDSLPLKPRLRTYVQF